MDQSLEHCILLAIVSEAPEEMIDALKNRFSNDLELYFAFEAILDEASGRESREIDLLADWRSYARRDGNRFTNLITAYVERFRQQERREGRKGKVSDLEELVSNHNKWHRMMVQHGVGNQYREDLRRACFVFRLTLPEATELLWSAGHPFDREDRWDFALADLLGKGIYGQAEVDAQLQKHHMRPLFRSL